MNVLVTGATSPIGAAIVADLLASRDVERVLAASGARETNEREKRSRLASGELGLDIYDMRERLRERGLRYEEERPG